MVGQSIAGGGDEIPVAGNFRPIFPLPKPRAMCAIAADAVESITMPTFFYTLSLAAVVPVPATRNPPDLIDSNISPFAGCLRNGTFRVGRFADYVFLRYAKFPTITGAMRSRSESTAERGKIHAVRWYAARMLLHH